MTLSPTLTTRKTLNLSPIMTPRKDGERSSMAQYACSNKSRHAALTSQGSRGHRTPRSSQTPSLCHAAPMRQHRTTTATGKKPTIRIRIDRTRVRSHPLWDGIRDKGLYLETSLAGGEPRPQRSGSWPSAPEATKRTTTQGGNLLRVRRLRKPRDDGEDHNRCCVARDG